MYEFGQIIGYLIILYLAFAFIRWSYKKLSGKPTEKKKHSSFKISK